MPQTERHDRSALTRSQREPGSPERYHRLGEPLVRKKEKGDPVSRPVRAVRQLHLVGIPKAMKA